MPDPFVSPEHAFMSGLVLSALRKGGLNAEPVMHEDGQGGWHYTPALVVTEDGIEWSVTVMPVEA